MLKTHERQTYYEAKQTLRRKRSDSDFARPPIADALQTRPGRGVGHRGGVE